MIGRGIFSDGVHKNTRKKTKRQHMYKSISLIMPICLCEKGFPRVETLEISTLRSPEYVAFFVAAQGCCRFSFACCFVFGHCGGEKIITKICAGNRKTKKRVKKSKCRVIHGAESGNCLREVA